LVFGRVTDEALIFSESDIRRGRVVALVVRDNLYFVIQPDTHTGVSGA